MNRTSNPTSWLVEQMEQRINLIYARLPKSPWVCAAGPDCEACQDDRDLVRDAAIDLMTFWEDLKARLTDVPE